MSEKVINSRVIHKHDIESHWVLATNFIPKQGEIIVYDRDENYIYERFKIGDGITLVNNLPFTNIQANWAQTDSAQPDYIKNKPKPGAVFSASILNNTFILEETGLYVANITNNVLLID